MRYFIIMLLCYFNALCSAMDAQIIVHDLVSLTDSASAEMDIQMQAVEPSLELITAQSGFTGFTENSLIPFTFHDLMIYTHRPDIAHYPKVILPSYTQVVFCDFEDTLNKGRKLRIDFSVK